MSRNMSMRSTTPCSTNWNAKRGLRCRLACARGAQGASVSAYAESVLWVRCAHPEAHQVIEARAAEDHPRQEPPLPSEISNFGGDNNKTW